ncbi:MAG: hypothetical protein H6613_12010 [Ignavibacteriales bacterium]|nr:hypothetical protein [Ignavibacteriales bacterium]
MEKEEFNYKTQSELLIGDLKESIKKEGYNSNLLEEVEKLDVKFDEIKQRKN